MAGRLLFDTDVLIDCLRDVPLAVDFLRQVSDTVLVSAVSVWESCSPGFARGRSAAG